MARRAAFCAIGFFIFVSFIFNASAQTPSISFAPSSMPTLGRLITATRIDYCSKALSAISKLQTDPQVSFLIERDFAEGLLQVFHGTFKDRFFYLSQWQAATLLNLRNKYDTPLAHLEGSRVIRLKMSLGTFNRETESILRTYRERLIALFDEQNQIANGPRSLYALGSYDPRLIPFVPDALSSKVSEALAEKMDPQSEKFFQIEKMAQLSAEQEKSLREFIDVQMTNVDVFELGKVAGWFQRMSDKSSNDENFRKRFLGLLDIADWKSNPLFEAGLNAFSSYLLGNKDREEAFQNLIARAQKALMTNGKNIQQRTQMKLDPVKLVSELPFTPEEILRDIQNSENGLEPLFDREPFYLFAVPFFRALILGRAENAHPIVRPKRTAKYGDYLFIHPRHQVSVWIKDNKIESLELHFLDEVTLAAIAPKEVTEVLVPSDFVFNFKPRPQVEARVPLPEADLFKIKKGEVSEEIRGALEKDINELLDDFRDRKSFISGFLEWVKEDSELQDYHFLSYLIGRLRSRFGQLKNGNLEESIFFTTLKNDAEKFFVKRERAKKYEEAVDLTQPLDAIPKNTIENFLNEDLKIENLQSEVPYSVHFPLESLGIQTFVFSPEAIEFLHKDSYPLQWLRAIKKGMVVRGSHEAGITTVHGYLGFDFKVKIIRRKFGHIRLSLTKTAENSWRVGKPVEIPD
ncbi:MAG: hypothetical protein J0L93_06120 [Deltaproteobacteria bacterium]|nr:hypothetical protein [Deltaproteobacteria bacterium]